MYFKILSHGQSCNGGKYTWSLPRNGKPGEWTQKLNGRLSMCHRGYHVAKNLRLFDWIGVGTQVYVCETKYKTIDGYSKILARQVRLLARVVITKDIHANIINDIKSFVVDIFKRNEDEFKGWDRVTFIEKCATYALRNGGSTSYLSKLGEFIHRVHSTLDPDRVDGFIMQTIIKHANLSKYQKGD